MSVWWIGYGAALVVMGVLDAAWLGFIARDFYRHELGSLLSADVRLLPAALFYLGYPAGLVTLALYPQPEGPAMAAWRSALVGLVAYGTYDLTNLATLHQWSYTLTLADVGWGAVASALAGTAAFMAMQRVGRTTPPPV
jgi:uncharacterized membrane protein